MISPKRPKWNEWIKVDRNRLKRTKVGRKGLTRTKMDQFFLKKKNISHTRFAPLYIFDTKNEIIKIINYIHVIKKLVVVIPKLLTL